MDLRGFQHKKKKREKSKFIIIRLLTNGEQIFFSIREIG